MNNLTRKKPADSKSNGDSERRKVGMVVHDDRGNASVSWRDAPADFDRPVLTVLDEAELSIMPEDTHDPYAHREASRAGDRSGIASGGGLNFGGSNRGSGGRRDLRKLSDWIKMMREREQRKREGGGGEESGG